MIAIKIKFKSFKCIGKKSQLVVDFDLVGKYCFEIGICQASSVNGELYKPVITNLFWTELNDYHHIVIICPFSRMAVHTGTQATLEILHERFEGIVSPPGCDVNLAI